MKTDRDISAAIMQIRIAAGGSATHCPTCGCPRETPYRFRVDGGQRIAEGCIDASHTEDMLERPAGDLDRAWHERPEVQEMRVNALARLNEIDPSERWSR
jgi:hypothetical protein